MSRPDFKFVEEGDNGAASSAAGVKEAARLLAARVDFLLEPTAWYFAGAAPPEAGSLPSDRWNCLFARMKKIQSGTPLALSARAPGCPGAAFYLGLNELPLMGAAIYLSCLERLKKDVETAMAFYAEVKPEPAREKILVCSLLADVPDGQPVEVVNLWPGVAGLSMLLTLANYDRTTNDNLTMPFSSGCQSIWTIPYKEAARERPRAVAGSLDPTVRRYLPGGALSFAVPAGRFIEMCANIEGSFMESGRRR